MRRERQQNGFNNRNVVVMVMAFLVLCRYYFGGKNAKTTFEK